MEGKALVQATFEGESPERPPYIPVVGRIAEVLAQIDGPAYASNPQQQAVALVEAASALHADAITVGIGAEIEQALDVVRRLKPMLGARALVGVLEEPEVQALRGYGEADVDVIMLYLRGDVATPKLKTLANTARFYRIPLVLVAPDTDDPLSAARDARLSGVVVDEFIGDEDVVVGGGLSRSVLNALQDRGQTPEPPRKTRFFWSFPGEVPADVPPEALAALGRALTG